MSTSNTSPKPLAGIGQRINSHFADLGKLDGQSESVEKAISNEQQRFQLWARNLGLYHRGHSSLDYRLRDSILLFDYTVGLLRDLENAISELQHKLKENLTAFDEPGNTSDEVHYQEDGDTISESDSDENLSSYGDEPIPMLILNTITSIIDRLYRLAFKIRNPRIRIGLAGTLTTAHKQLNAESDLIACLRVSDADRIQDLLRSYNSRHDAKRTEFLIQRLVNANALRRRQFEYWRHRRDQYEAESNFELTGVAASISQPATASVLDPKKIDLSESTSMASTGTSLRSAIDGSHLYSIVPNPPPLEAGAKEFECPYCYTLLPSTTHRKDKWELHIYRDLRPYTCTFEDCKDPDRQYDSFHDWMAHETSTHISHWQSANNNISLSLRSSIPSSTQSTSILVRKCPFCGDEAASAAHIASHLRRIACFALPSSESDESQDKTSFPGSEEAIFNSGRCNLCGFIPLNERVLKRHLNDKHHPQYIYSCPKPGCTMTQRRRDKIQRHIRTHPGYNPMRYERIEFACPAQCSVCSRNTTSWDAFHACVLSHYQKEEPSEEAMADSDSSEESLPRIADEANSPSRLSLSGPRKTVDRAFSSLNPEQVDPELNKWFQNFEEDEQSPPDHSKSTDILYSVVPRDQIPLAHGRSSPVEIISAPTVVRDLETDELLITHTFEQHVSQCPHCSQTLKTSPDNLCGNGRAYAMAVNSYLYSHGGKHFAVKDRKNGQLRQVKLPREAKATRDLLEGFEADVFLESSRQGRTLTRRFSTRAEKGARR